ncbi:MAG: nickel-dependent lactate racemase [Dongiaceae bacterium]
MTKDKAIDIAFGRGHLSIDLPADAEPTVIRKGRPAVCPDPRDAVRQALDNPMASPPFRRVAKGRRSACILICDITRPVPNALFLRPMIEDILAGGTPLDRVSVLVATGLHRPNEGVELQEIVGDPWVLENVRIENHFARNDADHVDLGVTATRGTPVKLDRRFVEADLRIATGLVEPHFMAGWSGGRKVIAPGIAHHETIRTFHSARFMEDPLAIQCNLAGNPLHEEQLEIVRMLGEVYGMNVVVDEERSLIRATFGEVIASHLAAVEFASNSAAAVLPRKFRTVVTSSAGYPLDKTYYQTIKAMVTPLDILEPGGTLIVASQCSEGFGSREFREAQARLLSLGPERFLATLAAKSLADVDEWQTEMQLKPMRLGRIQLYTTGLNDEERRITGVEMIDSVSTAIGTSIERHGDPAVAVIPEGPYVVPYCRSYG